MTTDIDLLPMPKGEAVGMYQAWSYDQMRDYARANVAHATAALQAEIETLRAEAAALTKAAQAQPDAGLDVEAVLRQFLTGDGYIAECDIKHIVAALTAQPKRRPYDASGSLSEYGVFPECDAQQSADDEVVFIDGVGAGRSSIKSCHDGVQWIMVGDRVYWPLSDSDAKRLQSACCGNGSFDGPSRPLVKVPSDEISVVGMPEFDALMDHIYENGTASEGVLPLANAFARAILAREAVRLNAQANPSMDSIVHAAVIRALDEAGVRNDVLRGMCIDVALEKARDMLEEALEDYSGSADMQLDAVKSTAAIAWGWLWHVTTADDRVKTARDLLGEMLDKDLKRYGIQTAKAEGAQANAQEIEAAMLRGEFGDPEGERP